MPIGCLWDVYGMSIGCLWDVYGMSMGCLWDCGVALMGHEVFDLWCCKFTPIGFDWTYGIAIWHLWGASIIYGDLWCCRFAPI